MADDIGRTRWAIPEGDPPAWTNGPEPQLASHEMFCVLNAVVQHSRLDSRQDANALLSTIAFPS